MKTIWQTGLLVLVWWLAERMTRLCHWPIPGSVLGLLILFLLFCRGWVKPAQVQYGATWLIKHMMLFFIPACIMVMNHPEFLGPLGLKLAVFIVAGPLVVMACTAITVGWLIGRYDDA